MLINWGVNDHSWEISFHFKGHMIPFLSSFWKCYVFESTPPWVPFRCKNAWSGVLSTKVQFCQFLLLLPRVAISCTVIVCQLQNVVHKTLSDFVLHCCIVLTKWTYCGSELTAGWDPENNSRKRSSVYWPVLNILSLWRQAQGLYFIQSLTNDHVLLQYT